MLEKYNDVLTVKDLCEILPVGRNSIYKLLDNNTIKHIRIGKKIIVPKKYLIEYLDSVA